MLKNLKIKTFFCVLCFCLLFSQYTKVTLADGETHTGGRCDTCEANPVPTPLTNTSSTSYSVTSETTNTDWVVVLEINASQIISTILLAN